jgi:pyruvate/2-oxoglutarate dehydrogenase complex dihydrolipoamide acyltransferase (E2) component
VDLTKIQGSGSGGRIVVEDVKNEEERRLGRPEATDAAYREAQRLGIDLSEVEATGTEGQIVVSDVVESAQRAEQGAVDSAGRVGEGGDHTAMSRMQEQGRPALQSQLPDGQAADENDSEEPKATNAARCRARDLGVDLSEVEGTGSGGQITVADVTGVGEDDRGAVGQAPKQSSSAAKSATSKTADGEVSQAQKAARQTDIPGEPRATNAARHKAEKLGIDLSRAKGSGVDGLITLKDLRRS